MSAKLEFWAVDLHMPKMFDDRNAGDLTHVDPVRLKLNLLGAPRETVYVTSNQKQKIEAAGNRKKEMTLRLGMKQGKYNIEAEKSFLSVMFQTAIRFLSDILNGIMNIIQAERRGFSASVVTPFRLDSLVEDCLSSLLNIAKYMAFT